MNNNKKQRNTPAPKLLILNLGHKVQNYKYNENVDMFAQDY